MINVKDIINLRYTSDDYQKTEELKNRINELKEVRDPMYLNLEEFDSILHWKLRGQYRRQISIREKNTNEIIRAITQTCFEIRHIDEEYETELKIGILCSIRGVGVPVASAILALYQPNKYCVIDFRGWRQVFGGKKDSFSNKDYIKYLKEIKKIANELNWPVQEVDLAIWEYDRR